MSRRSTGHSSLPSRNSRGASVSFGTRRSGTSSGILGLHYKSFQVFYCGQERGVCLCGSCSSTLCGPESGCPCASCIDLTTKYYRCRNEALISFPSILITVICHPEPLKLVEEDDGWVCEGGQLLGGCKQGCTGRDQTSGWTRYKSCFSDYSLCKSCVLEYLCDILIKNRSGNVANFSTNIHRSRIIDSSSNQYMLLYGHQTLYCGKFLNECACGTCDGRCGPNNGCPCNECREMNFELQTRLRELLQPQITQSDAPVATSPQSNLFDSFRSLIMTSVDEIEIPPPPNNIDVAPQPAETSNNVIPSTSASIVPPHEKPIMQLLDNLTKQDYMRSLLSSMNMQAIIKLEGTLQSALSIVSIEKEAMKDRVQQFPTCIVCEENPKTILLMPCKHLCLCLTCSEHPTMKKCPICRQHIAYHVEAYI